MSHKQLYLHTFLFRKGKEKLLVLTLEQFPLIEVKIHAIPPFPIPPLKKKGGGTHQFSYKYIRYYKIYVITQNYSYFCIKTWAYMKLQIPDNTPTEIHFSCQILLTSYHLTCVWPAPSHVEALTPGHSKESKM